MSIEQGSPKEVVSEQENAELISQLQDLKEKRAELEYRPKNLASYPYLEFEADEKAEKLIRDEDLKRIFNSPESKNMPQIDLASGGPKSNDKIKIFSPDLLVIKINIEDRIGEKTLEESFYRFIKPEEVKMILEKMKGQIEKGLSALQK